jgi:hypothetical protein
MPHATSAEQRAKRAAAKQKHALLQYGIRVGKRGTQELNQLRGATATLDASQQLLHTQISPSISKSAPMSLRTNQTMDKATQPITYTTGPPFLLFCVFCAYSWTNHPEALPTPLALDGGRIPRRFGR